MGPFIKDKNSVKKININIISCLFVIILISTYLSFIKYGFSIKGLYPIIVSSISIICSLFTHFIISKIVKQNKKYEIIPSLIFSLLLGINTPLYMVIIGSIIIEIGSLKKKYINFPLLVSLLIILICYLLKINVYDSEVIISSIKNLGSYETLITPYGYNYLISSTIIGGISLICIISLIYLIITKSIKWRITITIMTTIFIVTYFIGSINDFGIWYPIYNLLTLGTLFGSVFVIDNSPNTPIGQVLYGLFIGILTIIIRYAFGINEAIFISIFIVNFFTPLFDKIGAYSRFNLSKSLIPFTLAWVLIISIYIYMFVNFREINEFSILDKKVDTKEITYVVSNRNDLGVIKANIKVSNNKIIEFDIFECTDSNIENIPKEFINNIISNYDSLSSVPDVTNYEETSSSLKNIVENIYKDLKNENIIEGVEIVSKNIIDNQTIYIVTNKKDDIKIKAKLVFIDNKLASIEIIEMDEYDMSQIDSIYLDSLINNIDKIEEYRDVNKSDRLLKEAIKKVLEG